eukprot:CAMPEP_0206220096 /NCGR_PEP_ID=MMETSP0047_2-20121206/4698_1 /ASSEMBLY_ACC=CAM_ASM_000192 /TAXON_ID=195065 /ORGANISM="Chroomonas mesostigmatica_cf, Strain CCMP1168" /LENGTH=107 /DNA_ID=CAMNT_0053642739 /DNA_START=498 /DNA_END=821 /DNA_ORIENTATION=+
MFLFAFPAAPRASLRDALMAIASASRVMGYCRNLSETLGVSATVTPSRSGPTSSVTPRAIWSSTMLMALVTSMCDRTPSGRKEMRFSGPRVWKIPNRVVMVTTQPAK